LALALGSAAPTEYLLEKAHEHLKIVRRREAVDYMLDTMNGRTIAISHRPMANGGWVETHEDITERRAAEAKVAYMARHDALTLLPNRSLFQERLHESRPTRAGGRRF